MIDDAIERRRKKLIRMDKNLWESTEIDRALLLGICDGLYCWRKASENPSVASILCKKGEIATIKAEADVAADTCVVTFSIGLRYIVKTLKPFDGVRWHYFESIIGRDIIGPDSEIVAMKMFMDWIVERLAELEIIK